MTHGGQASVPERERVSQELYGNNYKELRRDEKKEVVDHCYGAGHTPPEREAELERAAELHKGEGPKHKPGGGS
ncbi:hypothetical protein HXX76_004742 [Chlamydomonas incerta]|uniref:Uncharacterized protein n=1 Tax=Chlamydomonas incerta TaxID=51695 RepID=A0A835TKI3_CHLIN|nr:hypothetical protein HXX76_004742 [Chlamydomonas incerta]|eukprot:KAG2439385.1 hypothetical protein HXX76_004742 [Chlamydomonas incerta]